MAQPEQILKKWKALWEDKQSYRSRLWLSGAVALAFAFTFLFFGPLELVAFSGGSLVYTWQDVVWLLLAVMVLFVAVVAPLLALLRGKIFRYAICIAATLVVGGYIQALMLNGGLGLLTGDGIDWQQHAASAVWGLVFWAVLLVAFLLTMYLDRTLWNKAVKALCLLLTFMQLVPAVGIFCGLYDEAKTDSINNYYLSDRGFYEFSQKENVLVFVLDRLDYDYIEKVLAEDPDFFAGLEGFTSYTNAISGFARTKPALLHMLTGAEEKAFQMSYGQYYKAAWLAKDQNLLEQLQAQGYSAELYTNIRNLFSQPELAVEYVDNTSTGKDGMDFGVTLQKLLQLSAYRYAPTALKPFYWADTNYYNTGVYHADAYSAYQFDDAAYGAGFVNSLADRTEGSFKLYHFFGPHAPYSMNADGTENEAPTTVTDQTMGSFVNLMKLFAQMKALGIYDDATIIITGDHGNAVSDLKPVQKATRVGLFYKPAGASGEFTESAAPVTTEQVAATVIKAIGGDYSDYGPALDEIAEDADIVRTYYKTVCDPETFRETELCIYHIAGDAADFANWELVERRNISYNYN